MVFTPQKLHRAFFPIASALIYTVGFFFSNAAFADSMIKESGSRAEVFDSGDIDYRFRLEDISVEGLQRLPISLIFSTLPINIGDVLDKDRIAFSLRRLYQTGKFQDIKFLRSGNELIIRVSERPSISDISIEGNKIIETEALEQGLRESGLEKGSVLQRQTLDRIKLELERQYVAQGRYGAEVKVDIEPKPRNRVAVKITIKEGEVAKIKHINIVGNTIVSESELLDLLQLKTTHFWSFFKNDDRYAREKLSGDLESIRSYYLDRGYINFNIESALVSVGIDKKTVYITINLHEGQAYEVGEVNISGDLKLLEDELRKLLVIQPKQTFSRRHMTLSSELMSKRLGNDGYTFAEVKGYPQLNPETNKVDVRFFVNPGNRIYVRRVEFSGNTKTKDEVLRREMRQMEGSWAEGNKIQRSKARLERLGFFKTVQVDTPKVAGTDDQIDLQFKVEEQPSGSIGASIGYQGGTGLVFGANVSQTNFLGTGNRVAFGINRTRTQNSYNFRYVNPYYTVDGVSRGFNLFFRETDFDEDSNLSSFRTDAHGVGLNFGYPIDEHSRLNFGVGFDNTRVHAFSNSAQEVKDFIGYDLNGANSQSDDFSTYFIEGSWYYNKLNRGLLPDRGFSHRISVELALPGSDNLYYKTSYNWQHYIGLGSRYALRLRSELGYGDGWKGDDTIPFYKHFYAGGFGSVRGYDDRSLGPRDERDDAFGGNLLIEGSLELIVPTPFAKDQRAVRTTLFIDTGNVFNTEERDQLDHYFDELRYSAGASLTWITGIGPIAFSWAVPFNEAPEDDVQKFQFSIGRTF